MLLHVTAGCARSRTSRSATACTSSDRPRRRYRNRPGLRCCGPASCGERNVGAARSAARHSDLPRTAPPHTEVDGSRPSPEAAWSPPARRGLVWPNRWPPRPGPPTSGRRRHPHLRRRRGGAQAGGRPSRSTAVLHALDGGFIPAGPSGSPLRGLINVLPTGRNFYPSTPRRCRHGWHGRRAGRWPTRCSNATWPITVNIPARSVCRCGDQCHAHLRRRSPKSWPCSA